MGEKKLKISQDELLFKYLTLDIPLEAEISTRNFYNKTRAS